MNTPQTKRRRCRGSALVLVFWCLLLLSLAVFAIVELVGMSVDHSAQEERALDAHAWAASGVAVGEEPQLLRDDPLLNQQSSPTNGFRVTFESEGARLNLNYLLLTGHRAALVTLFTHWGMKMDEAEHAAACLYDWVMPGDLPSLNGAKADAYAKAGLPQRPSHAAFISWDEVEMVMGVDAIAAVKPNWKTSFTLLSEGPLDVNQAPAERIAALFGIDEGRVEFLVKMRDGRDGLPGTGDDVPLNSETLQSGLALSPDLLKAMQSQIAFGSNIRRVESIGRAGSTYVKISVVTRLNTVPPQLLVWSER